MSRKTSLPEIISSKVQFNQIRDQRGFLFWMRRELQKYLYMHAGKVTEDREAALDAEIETYTQLLDTYDELGLVVRWKVPDAPGRTKTEQPEDISPTIMDYCSINQIGITIIRARLRLKVKRAALARAVGTSSAQLCRYEKNLYANAPISLVCKLQCELAKQWSEQYGRGTVSAVTIGREP